METYLKDVAKRYTTFFNVYRNEHLGDVPLTFYAQYKRRDEKYFLTKKLNVWGIENQQVVFVIEKDHVTLADIQQLKREMLYHAESYIPKHSEHMSTSFLGVVVANGRVEESAIKAVRSFRKIKFFKYGFHGWGEFYLGIVHLPEEDLFVHRKGKEFMRLFRTELGIKGG
ncbi:MAG TPA: hypothetical protein GX525_10100 [Bacilli bacterium]|nr:hypothetical protein [Bacilli bacterium]